jgi:hypothetical protein
MELAGRMARSPVVEECSLSAWSGRPGRCRWCDVVLTPQRAVAGDLWCSMACDDEYHRNHRWELARLTALARDDHRCVQCGLGPASVSEGHFLLRALCPMGAVEAAALFDSAEWRRFRIDCQVEVHHLVAREGGGYGAGCHHHLDGLATLCHRHHA